MQLHACRRRQLDAPSLHGGEILDGPIHVSWHGGATSIGAHLPLFAPDHQNIEVQGGDEDIPPCLPTDRTSPSSTLPCGTGEQHFTCCLFVSRRKDVHTRPRTRERMMQRRCACRWSPLAKMVRNFRGHLRERSMSPNEARMRGLPVITRALDLSESMVASGSHLNRSTSAHAIP